MTPSSSSGNKGSAFVISLNVPTRDVRRGGPTQAVGPPRRSLGYMGMVNRSSVQSKLIVQLMSFARTVFGQLKHAKKIPMGSFLA